MSPRKSLLAGPPARGPRGDRGVLADRILVAARASFAVHGFAGTTLRSVAQDADVDPSLVNYYFTNKAGLLEAVLTPPDGFVTGIAQSSAAPARTRGRAMVTSMLGMWERPDAADVLRSIILTAAHEPVAMQRVQQVFADGILAAVARHLDDDQRDIRASLISSQLVGLAMTRYVWKIGVLATLPVDQVVDLIAPTVQRYLTAPLAQ